MSWWWWHDQPFWEHFQHGFRDARIESASQNPCWNIIHQDVCATKPPLKVLSNRHPCTLYSGIHYGSTSGPNYQNLRGFLVSKNYFLQKINNIYMRMKYEWTMEIYMKYEWNMNEIWMKYEWNINEIWMKYKWNNFKYAKKGSILLRARRRFDEKIHAKTWKFENAKVRDRCGVVFEGKRGRFLRRVVEKIPAWYIKI